MADLAQVKKLDLGAGMRKKEDTFGIDKTQYDGIDLVQDLRFKKLPFADGQIEYIYTAHFLEHLTFEEILFIMNEMWRVLKVGSLAEVIVPHGMSYSHWSDISHKTAWTEDSFGHFTPHNMFYYEWQYEHEGKKYPVINRWKVCSNDTTMPYKYTTDGWVEIKNREIRAILQKLPMDLTGINYDDERWLEEYKP